MNDQARLRCDKFVPLVNDGDYRGTICCHCGEKEKSHRTGTTMLIEVTQQDIDAGVPNVCDRCPVALAVNRAIAGLGLGTCEVGATPGGDDGSVVIAGRLYEAPEAVGRFVRAFDDGRSEDCAPFWFELPIVPIGHEFDAQPGD